MLIKIKCRKNLLYLFIYYISTCIGGNNSMINAFLHSYSGFTILDIGRFFFPLVNIIGGLIVFLYQKYSTRKKEKPKYFGINLIIRNKKYIPRDGKLKKILLIFFASYFIYYKFLVNKFYDVKYISMLMDFRLSSIQIIVSTFIFFYTFGFKIQSHHKASLIIMSIFFGILILTDMIFIIYYKYKMIRAPIFQYFITLFFYIGFSFSDCIEKYLVDYNYMNPFLILMLEGVFQLIMALLSIIWIDPFIEFKMLKDKKRFSIVFIVYALLQIIINIYRIYCNVIYTPMARSLIDYLINPLMNISIMHNNMDIFHHNVTYFIICEIICIVLSFFGCVFNEYIILYCCGLEHDTQDEVANRANNQSQNELNDNDEASNNNENPENDDNIKKSNTIISLGGYGLGI